MYVLQDIEILTNWLHLKPFSQTMKKIYKISLKSMTGGQGINSNFELPLKNDNIINSAFYSTFIIYKMFAFFPMPLFKINTLDFISFICPFNDVCSNLMVLKMHG